MILIGLYSLFRIFFLFYSNLGASQTVITTVEYRVDDPSLHQGNSNSLSAKFIALNAHNVLLNILLIPYPTYSSPGRFV